MRKALGFVFIASLFLIYSVPAEATCRTYKVSFKKSGSSVIEVWLLSSKSNIESQNGKQIIEKQAKANYGNAVSVYYSGGSGGTNECSSGQKSSADRVVAQ